MADLLPRRFARAAYELHRLAVEAAALKVLGERHAAIPVAGTSTGGLDVNDQNESPVAAEQVGQRFLRLSEVVKQGSPAEKPDPVAAALLVLAEVVEDGERARHESCVLNKPVVGVGHMWTGEAGSGGMSLGEWADERRRLVPDAEGPVEASVGTAADRHGVVAAKGKEEAEKPVTTESAGGKKGHGGK